MLKFQQQPNTGAAFTAQDRNDISEIVAQVCEAFGVALGADVATAVRLQGAVLSSGTVSAGIVYYNREVFEVLTSSGLSINPYAVLVESNPTDEPRTNFINGVPTGTTVTKKLRKLQFADSGAPLFQYSDLVDNKAKRALDGTLPQNLVRSGMIMDYFGPFAGRFDLSTGLGIDDYTGFALCDGRNGTPDMRGLFTVMQTYAISGDTSINPHKEDSEYFTQGTLGGAKEVTLTEAQMPAHNHQYEDYLINNTPSGARLEGSPTSNIYGNTETKNTNTKGSGQAHENRPPYKVLAKIMKL